MIASLCCGGFSLAHQAIIFELGEQSKMAASAVTRVKVRLHRKAACSERVLQDTAFDERLTSSMSIAEGFGTGC
jgi:hypothetical protein